METDGTEVQKINIDEVASATNLDALVIKEALDEYELIKRKVSKLSANERRAVVWFVEGLQKQEEQDGTRDA